MQPSHLCPKCSQWRKDIIEFAGFSKFLVIERIKVNYFAKSALALEV
jgi:hypothetical protein